MRLGAEAERAFPEKVTAFRKDMAVHGRYESHARGAAKKIQRIRYADKRDQLLRTVPDWRKGSRRPKFVRVCCEGTGRGRWMSWRR